MPLIVKGSINGLVQEKKVDNPPPSPAKVTDWNSLKQTFIKEEKIQPEIIKKEPSSNYHVEKHGELEKMFNTKSDYLKDILDL